MFSSVLPITAGAVSYPQGLTEEQVLGTIPKLNNVAKGLLSSMPGSADLKSTVYSALYKDETVNMLFKSIYEMLGENAETLSSVGVDVSPAALSAATKAFPAVSKKLAACKNISEAVAASSSFRWDINNKNEFKNAVASMLSPFNELLNVILCSGTLKINNLISISGDDGYTTAIVPLLNALDCPSVMSSSEFSAEAAKNRSSIIRNILTMVFDALDRLLDNPVTGMCETLPKIAYYIDSGKLSASVTALLEPLSLKIAGIITIPGLSDLISNAANLDESLDINSLLGSADLGALTGAASDIKLPEIDIKAFAACVTDNSGTLTVDKGAAFLTLMNFILDTLKMNKDSLGSLMGTGEGTADMLSPFFEKSNDEIIYSVVTLFNVTSAPENNPQINYPAMTPGYVTYTPTLDAADYERILNEFDPLLTDFVKEQNPDSNIEETLRKTIYSNATLSEIVVGLYSVLGSDETAGLFSMLGMNVTPAGIASSISSSYPYAASILSRYSSWEKENPGSLSWGFYDGDAVRFQKALTKVLSPFIPVFSCLLAGTNVTFMDAVTIPGSNGYNTAVIPLLEALGCDSSKIKTYGEYAAGAGTDKILTDIFTPVFALIDEICASPVKTIVRILPNLIYFFENGLLEETMSNLLYPIEYMLEKANLSSLLDGMTDAMPEMDMSSLLGELTSSMDMGITLPEIDLSPIGTYGTPTTLTSKRVVNGQYAQYTYIISDTSAVTLTLLRTLVGVMMSEENSDMMSGLMGGGAEGGDGDMFAMYTGDIAEKLSNMTDDEKLEWLCNLFFHEKPEPQPEKDDVIPEIIYKKRFKLSTTAKLIIVLAPIALAALIYYILSVSGKLDNVKLKRSKKKEMKRRKKEAEMLRKAGAVTAPPEKRPEKAIEKHPAPAKAPSPVQKPVPPAAPAASPRSRMKADKVQTANDLKDEKLAKAKHPDNNTAAKLESRRIKAEKQAMKNAEKNQKQYEKIVKQAAKKK